MNIRQRDLVLVAFPFSNLREAKIRPAVVLSQTSYNKGSADILVVPVTSSFHQPHAVPLTQNDMESGRLLRDSFIKADHLFSIEKRLVNFVIGRVGRTVFGEVVRVLNGLFVDETV